eukprot:TRINITY_DN21005_c1_g1_i1.p1 TRINITY_DN21005_c1_g1~~TRINITY_DN21005_c1_g1_i1.p1  ORF type:complete len:336 (+),score=47.91 TRINITY_DN21005_c1_g1_i1:46-1008(+)
MPFIDAPYGDPCTWRVGDCTVTRVIEIESSGGQTAILPGATKELTKSIEWLAPNFADEKGRMIFAIQLMVVDAPGGIRIAVDTCVGNDKKREFAGHWHMRKGPFLEHLELAGIPPASVTHVFCTHLHTDHIGWNTMWVDGKWVPTFPNARYLFGKKEFDFWSAGGTSGTAGTGGIEEELADSVLPIVNAGMADFVEMDHVLLHEGDTRIYLRPTVGHTHGHTSLMIESRGARAIITGDCFHHPAQFTETALSSSADNNPAQATQTRENLLKEFCGSDCLVFGTHFARPTVGLVVPHTRKYKLDTEAAKATVVATPRQARL